MTCIVLSCLASSCLALHCHALPRLAIPNRTTPALKRHNRFWDAQALITSKSGHGDCKMLQNPPLEAQMPHRLENMALGTSKMLQNRSLKVQVPITSKSNPGDLQNASKSIPGRLKCAISCKSGPGDLITVGFGIKMRSCYLRDAKLLSPRSLGKPKNNIGSQ